MRATASRERPARTLESDGTLSLLDLMDSLEPRERPVDPDATLYFPIDERHVRAGSYRPQSHAPEAFDVSEPAPQSTEESPKTSPSQGSKSCIAKASLVKKSILLLLLGLIGMFTFAPMTRRGAQRIAPAAPAASVKAALPPNEDLAVASEPSPSPRRARSDEGVSLERAAADRVARGDFTAALELYRELAETHVDKVPFAQAARILEHRLRREDPRAPLQK